MESRHVQTPSADARSVSGEVTRERDSESRSLVSFSTNSPVRAESEGHFVSERFPIRHSAVDGVPRIFVYEGWCPSGYPWINVFVDKAVLVSIRARYLFEVSAALDRTCLACYRFVNECRCSYFVRRSGEWVFTDEFDRPVWSELCKFSRDRRYVNARFDDEVILQGNSVESLTTEVLSQSDSSNSIGSDWPDCVGWGPRRAWMRDDDFAQMLVKRLGPELAYHVFSYNSWEYNYTFEDMEDFDRFSYMWSTPELQGNCHCSADCEIRESEKGPQLQGFEEVMNDENFEIMWKIFEDITTFMYQARDAKTIESLVVAQCALIRSVTGQSIFRLSKELSKMVYCELAQYFKLQGNSWFDGLENLYSQYSKVKNSKLAEKFLKVFNHTVAHCIYHKLGIEFDSTKFALIEEKKLRPSMKDKGTFLEACADMIMFLLKQGRQFMITGDIEAFFISEDSIGQWYTTARRLVKDFEFLNNPDAVGLKIHDYLRTLRKTIEDGKRILKIAKFGSYEHKIVSSMTLELESLENRYLCTVAALSMRRQPFGVVLFGDPGIGKSSLTDIIANFHALRMQLSTDRDYIFFHNSEEEYMTNFKSYQHTVVLDDVAQQKADRVQGVDMSTSLLIKIINNAPFSPPQAAIDDKGKTPMMNHLAIVTTNVKDMNVPFFYTASLAVYRRLPVHIQPIVKDEYRKDGESSLDPSKADLNSSHPDYWRFVVREPKKITGMVGEYHVTHNFASLKDLLEWLGPVIDKHHRNQDFMLLNADKYKTVTLCETCRLPKPICTCCPQCKMMIEKCICHVPQKNSVDFEEKEGERYYGGDPQTQALSGFRVFRTQRGDEAPHIEIEEVEEVEDPPIWGREEEYEPTPWRVIQAFRAGDPRYFSESMARKFVRYMVQQAPKDDEFFRDATTHYAFVHLPKLMDYGYSNREIVKDFRQYIAWKEQSTDYKNFVNLMTANVDYIQNPILRWWAKIWFQCYFTFGWFRFGVLYAMRYTWIAGFMYWCFGGLVKSTRVRREFMMQWGRSMDEKMKGMSPFAKMFSLYVCYSIMSKIYNAYLHSTNVKEHYRMFTDMDEAERVASERMAHLERRIQEMENLEKSSMHVRQFRERLAARFAADEEEKKEHLLKAEELELDLAKSKVAKKKQELEKLEEELLELKVTMEYAELENQQPQGILQEFGKVPEHAPGDEKKNVWIQPERPVTRLDFTDDRATTLESLLRSLSASCVIIEVVWKENGVLRKYIGRAMLIGNDNILTNSHALPRTMFDLTVFMGRRHSLSPHSNLSINPEQIQRYAPRDIAIVRTKGLPMLRNLIHKNFPLDSFEGSYDGYYMIRQDDGSFKKVKVVRIQRIPFNRVVNGNQFATRTWVGRPECHTIAGDCGSPLIMDTGYGPIVVGMHFMYDEAARISYATCISMSDVLPLVREPHVQCGVIDTDMYQIVDVEKSFLDFHEEGHVMYHGELNLMTARPKTRVCRTEVADYVFSRSCNEYPIVDTFSKPLMHSWKPQQTAFKEFLQPASGLDEILLANCAQELFLDIMKHLPKEELNLIHPYPIDCAVNGMVGMAYVDPIKRNTSTGYPFNTPKKKYLEPLNDPRWPDGVKLSPEYEARVEKWLNRYREGIRNHPIANANLKDEVVSQKKHDAWKTRVFFSTPTEFLIIIRMMFLGFTRVVQRNWKVFHCVIGVNCHSDQWNEVYHIMTEFGTENFVAGDFAGFDKKFAIVFLRWAFWIIKEICRASGNFTAEHMLIIECIEADLTNCTVNWFGMLITLLGGMVSGHQLTTIFNCFLCILYLMYSFALKLCITLFFEYVRVFSLGDDHFVAVHPKALFFTHKYIKEVLDSIGVGYTMAEKDAPFVDFVSIEQVTFLKRRFVYHEALGCICGPLEQNSIFKMLTYHTKSKACSESEQLAQAIMSASAEAFYHGRHFFDFIEDIIETMPKSESLAEHMKAFPRFTWEQNIERFWSASSKPAHTAVLKGRNHIELPDCSYCIVPELFLQGSMRVGVGKIVTRVFPKVRFYGRARLLPIKETKVYSNEFSYVPENNQLSKSNEEINNQVSSVPETGHTTDLTQEQTVFYNETTPEALDLSTSPDPLIGELMLEADLRSFLSRPAKIAAYSWNEGQADGIRTRIYPWRDYFNLTQIKNKLTNFGLIACDLKLKIVINASPFYYGSIAAVYNPLELLLSDTAGYAANGVGYRVAASQRPKVWLDPQTTSSAEMTLPFLWYNNYINTDLAVNFQNMGSLVLVQYTDLRSANAAVGVGATINIYAWAENVRLSGPTAMLALQGRNEYKVNGQISGIASTVGNIAGRLRNAPVVGPLAKATEVVSDAVGNVASFFGFTNVPVIEDVTPMKSLPFHTLASAHISEPINKLSLQPKQETAIGPVHGDTQVDPLHIANFASRESFLGGTLWTTTNVEDDILFTASVQPSLYETEGTTNYKIYHTPMSYPTEFFQYWRGDIIFRFKIIKTKYHKGRLNICWDSQQFDPSLMPTVGDPSVFNIVVDLDEDDEIEFRVPYMQGELFMPLTTNVNAKNWSNGGAPTGTWNHNGIIQMRVLNVLSAPTATSSLTVLVFVRAAENIEFAGPRNMRQDMSLLSLQGKTIELNKPTQSDPQTYDEVFGEKIVSMRELLHRQSKCWTQIIPKDADWAGNLMTFSFPLQRTPRTYGYQTGGWERAAGVLVPGSNFDFNFVRNHPINWIVACFVGYKGSVNYNINGIYNAGNSMDCINSIAVCRLSDVPPSYKPRAYSTLAANSTSQLMKNLNTPANVERQGAAGMALTNQRTQAGIAFNFPYYLPVKFIPANETDPYSSTARNWRIDYDLVEVTVKRGITTATTTDANMTLDLFCGTGPDFNVIFFLNCPVLNYLVSPTALATG